MIDYVILLRGINVGGKNVLPMQELRSLLAADGFDNVRSYIQSGNILVASKKVVKAEEIASLIQKKFGFLPSTLVLSEKQFIGAAKANPFLEGDGKAVHFYFCAESPNVNQEAVEKYKSASEEFAIEGKVCYLHAPDGIGRSKLVANIEKCLGVTATGRNLNTVLKLQNLLDQ